MSRHTILMIGLLALGVAGCGKSGSELVGTWTGETSHKNGDRFQITMTLGQDGTEKLLTVPEGAGLTPGPAVDSNGTYAVDGQTLSQHLDLRYPASEMPLTPEPGTSATAPMLKASWTIDDTGALVLSQPGGSTITLHKV